MSASTLGILFGSVLVIFYFTVHMELLWGIHRMKQPTPRLSSQPLVSVIVAARNEEKTIGTLLECLAQQTYSKKEIIIVDDRSTDQTAKIIEAYKNKIPALTCLHIISFEDDFPAKKNALRAAIQTSRGEILCFTDADCFPPPNWIEELVGNFSHDTGLVAGYSPYIVEAPYNNILHQFINYEELRGGIWAAGSIGLRRGWLCTGRNLAYRRSVYDEVGGFEKIKMSISGDDDMFLQLVRRETKWKISYVLSPNSFVPTLPPKTFTTFVNQRKRHFSASQYLNISQKLFFIFYHGANLLLFATIPCALIFPSLFWIASFGILKFLIDALLMVPNFSTFRTKQNFLFMEIFYIFYNTFIGPLGLIASFDWKSEAAKQK
ncbi:MAG TPA: glycosyltransferase [Bacteroidota bacterium]|nr:glycosyltransferase [Bacteroidota bacterium]